MTCAMIGSYNDFSMHKISEGRCAYRNLGTRGKLPYSPQLIGFIMLKDFAFCSKLEIFWFKLLKKVWASKFDFGRVKFEKLPAQRADYFSK